MGVSERPTVIVGVDFGTTFSGVAWGLEDCPDDIELIQTWPGGGNSELFLVNRSQDCETDRLLASNDPKGSNRVVIPGQKDAMGPSSRPVLPPGKGASTYPRRQASVGPNSKVSGDYLGKVVAHAQDILTRRFGNALQTMELQYILTVPAVWSDKAKYNTKQAALKAGIPASDLRLLSEPEAAAVCAIRTIQPNSIAEGDCLVVCDAGGGTVDIITYRVKQTEPLRFTEATEGTGAVCGSVMLDERFDALIKDIIEQKSHQALPRATAAAARKYWQDYIKPGYAGPLEEDEYDDPGYWVPVPGVSGIKEVELSDGHLYLDKGQVKGIFDPIIQQIEDLISEQRKSIKALGFITKAIILVGGLGASEYLFKRIQAASNGVQIMQPPNAWSAIARGAVHRGQEGNQVDSRMARCHYGIIERVQFDPSLHASKTREWCKWEEDWKVSNHMSWFINKGESTSEGSPIQLSFYRTVGLSESLKLTTKLRFCQEATAPEWLDSSVPVLCELEADLSRVPRELFETRINSKGKEYYKVNYDLILTPTSASLLFELQFNGVPYGSVRSRY